VDSIEQALARAASSRVISVRRTGVTGSPAAASSPVPGPGAAPDDREPLWRHVIGDVLRRERLAQGRTLKDVSDDARISMPYLSEIERGRKEASSEVLAAAARALGLGLADLLALAQDELGRNIRAQRGPKTPTRFPTGFGPTPVRPDPRGGHSVPERAHEPALSAASETRIADGGASALARRSGTGSASTQNAPARPAAAPRAALCLAA
jgi:transcriptional regulator with XRE-family HTH domain